MDAAISSGAHFGKGSSDVQDALAKLTVSYQDPNKALQMLSLSEDIAASKHITLAAAADMVGRAHAGSGKAFKEFGINVKDQSTLITAAHTATKAQEAAVVSLGKAEQSLSDLEARDAGKKKLTIADQQALTKAHEAVAAAQTKVNVTTAAAASATAKASDSTKDYDKILTTQLAPRLKGIAEAQAETFGGRLDEARTRVMNFTAAIGKSLGPALVIIGPILMGLGGVIQAFTMITWAGVTATWAFLWPILAVIAVIAVLAAGFLWAYTSIKPFHDAVNKIADAIRTELLEALKWLQKTWTEVWPLISRTVGDVWNFLQPIFRAIVQFGVAYIGVELTVLRAVWTAVWFAISNVASLVWTGYLKPLFTDMGAAFGPIGSALTTLKNNVWDPIWAGIVRTVQGAWVVLKPIFDGIGNFSGTIGNVLGAVGNFMGSHSGAASLPGRAGGGPTSAGQAYMVGENGPEMFLSNSSGTITPNNRLGGGIGAVTININGANQSPLEIAISVREELLRLKRSTGNLGLA